MIYCFKLLSVKKYDVTNIFSKTCKKKFLPRGFKSFKTDIPMFLVVSRMYQCVEVCQVRKV